MLSTIKNFFLGLLKTINSENLKLPENFPEECEVEERNRILTEIFTNTSSIKMSCSSIVCCFMGIVASVLFTVVPTMLPVHDVFVDHSYWYEWILLAVIGWAPIGALCQVNTCLFLLGTGGLKAFKACLITYLTSCLCMTVVEYHFYVFWVYVGGHTWPFPFQGYFAGLSGWFVMSVILWVQCPTSWKTTKNSRKKIIYAVLLTNSMGLGEIAYRLLLWFFQTVDENYQWTLAFVLLATRAFHFRILSFAGGNIVGSQDLSVKIIAANYSSIRHVLFLSVNLVNTTTLTSYLILSSDFVINLVSCAKILWYIKNPSEKTEVRKQLAILVLVVNETVEFIAPISYGLCLLMAYFGPNANLLGNVKNDLWQYVAIDDIYLTFFWIAVMFFVDLLSTVITILALYIWGNINVVKSYIQMQTVIGYLLVIQQAYMMNEYVSMLHISFGMDYTFKFDWIYDSGNSFLGNNTSTFS